MVTVVVLKKSVAASFELDSKPSVMDSFIYDDRLHDFVLNINTTIRN